MPARNRQYLFGSYRLDPVEGLFRDSEPIALRPKPLLLLTYFVEHSGRVLSTSAILSDVWTDTVVDARGLKTYVSQLRKALGDEAASPTYIETLPKRGYRFKHPVQVIAAAPPPEVADTHRAVERASSARPVREGHEREPEAFVGRTMELARLDDLLRDVLNGAGRLVFVTGETGIGKTTLAHEFLRRAQRRHPDVLIAHGRCLEHYGTSEAYLPFLDALGGLLGGRGREQVADVLQAHAPTWCLQLPYEFASMGTLAHLLRETIGATKDRMVRELGDALAQLTADIPVILLLDDVHWADASSTDLLRHLASRLAGQRLMIIATLRPEAVERSAHPLRNYRATLVARTPCEELPLTPLTAADVARYLDMRFAANAFSEDLARTLYSRTEGHPLFTLSLVQFLMERGDIAAVNGGWTLTRPLAGGDLRAPEGLRSVIRGQIDALDERDRRVLQYASVQGGDFLSSVLAQLSGIDEATLEERLQRLDRVHRLIRIVGDEELADGTVAQRYRFRHTLHQNVLYDDLVSARRTLLHREAGEQLLRHYGSQAGRVAAQLAMHFELGRDFARAADYTIRMGDNAAASFANADAEQHYTKALQLAARLPEEERRRREVAIYRRRAIVNLNVSRFEESLADFERMRELAAGLGDATAEAAALNGATRALFFSHRLEEMARMVDAALQAADRSGDPAIRLETMTLIGLRRLGYGELQETAVLLDETIDTARRIDAAPALAAALAWRGALHYWQSEYERADRVLTEARELAAALQDGFVLLFSLFIQGLARGNQGRISDALDSLMEANRIAERNGDQFWSARLPNCIGWIHRELQDFDRAIEHDRRGIDLGGARHVVEAQANALINLGVDYTERGHEWAKAQEVLREVEQLFARDEWFQWRYNIRLQAASAEYWLRAKDFTRAHDHVERLDATARHYGAWKYVALADFLRARIALRQTDEAAARDHLLAASKVLREYPAPLVSWKVDALLARLETQAQRGEAASEARARAASTINAIALNTRDDAQRACFLGSAAVTKALAGVSVP